MPVETNSRRFFSDNLYLVYTQVFSKVVYVIIAGLAAAVFWILFNVMDQLLFFTPIFIFYLPPDAVAGFVISTINSVLLGVVISMNVYILKNTRFKFSKSLLSGSSIGVISSELLFFWFFASFYLWCFWNYPLQFSFQLSNPLALVVISSIALCDLLRTKKDKSFLFNSVKIFPTIINFDFVFPIRAICYSRIV
jgi:Na+/melibiose symporter-like transporter